MMKAIKTLIGLASLSLIFAACTDNLPFPVDWPPVERPESDNPEGPRDEPRDDPAPAPSPGGQPGTGQPPAPSPNATPFQLTLSMLLDGGRDDVARDIAVDGAGNIYVVGGTQSPNFPVTNGAFDTSYNSGGSMLGNAGPMDAFVVKANSAGVIQWATFLGGPNYDRAYAVEVDQQGNVYVAGRAGAGFPTTANALQQNFQGDSAPNRLYGPQDGFVTKLSPDGSRLIWSTYVGESNYGFIRDIDVDRNGKVHIAANVGGRLPFVSANAIQKSLRGQSDSAYIRLSANGRQVEYATYLGGNETGRRSGTNPTVRVRSDGGVYFANYDNSTNVSVTANAFQKRSNGNYEIVVYSIAPNGSLEWATYLGGSELDDMETHALAIDSMGRPVIAAQTLSKNFPVTAGAFQTRPGDPVAANRDPDGFVSILSRDGSRLVASTYFGGPLRSEFEGVAVLPDGSIVVTGRSRSSGLPVTSNAFQRNLGGGYDAIIVQFSPDLKDVLYMSYLGGPGDDQGRAIAVAPQGRVYIAGQAGRNPFPTTAGGDRKVDGNMAAFAAGFKQ